MMRCYIAIDGAHRLLGGWFQCLSWAANQIQENDSGIVKIHVARGGEKNARIVAEATRDGLRLIQHGRYVPVRKLLEGTGNGKA